MTQFYLHVGLPKTGTTTLQQNLFALHPEINYLGRPLLNDLALADIHKILEGKKVPEEAAKKWQKLIKTSLNEPTTNKKLTLFSDENLSGITIPKTEGPVANIKNFFNADQVIVTLRRQQDLLLSLYQHRRSRGRETCSFEEWFEREWDINWSDHLDWHEFINSYVQVYGRENVHILIFEEYRSDFESYASDICQIMDIDGDVGKSLIKGKHAFEKLSERQMRFNKLMKAISDFKGLYLPEMGLSRFIPSFVKSSVNTVAAGGKAKKFTIPEWVLEKIEEKSVPGNQKLINEYKLPLKNNNYFV